MSCCLLSSSRRAGGLCAAGGGQPMSREPRAWRVTSGSLCPPEGLGGTLQAEEWVGAALCRGS